MATLSWNNVSGIKEPNTGNLTLAGALFNKAIENFKQPIQEQAKIREDNLLNRIKAANAAVKQNALSSFSNLDQLNQAVQNGTFNPQNGTVLGNTEYTTEGISKALDIVRNKLSKQEREALDKRKIESQILNRNMDIKKKEQELMPISFNDYTQPVYNIDFTGQYGTKADKAKQQYIEGRTRTLLNDPKVVNAITALTGKNVPISSSSVTSTLNTLGYKVSPKVASGLATILGNTKENADLLSTLETQKNNKKAYTEAMLKSKVNNDVNAYGNQPLSKRIEIKNDVLYKAYKVIDAADLGGTDATNFKSTIQRMIDGTLKIDTPNGKVSIPAINPQDVLALVNYVTNPSVNSTLGGSWFNQKITDRRIDPKLWQERLLGILQSYVKTKENTGISNTKKEEYAQAVQDLQKALGRVKKGRNRNNRGRQKINNQMQDM